MLVVHMLMIVVSWCHRRRFCVVVRCLVPKVIAAHDFFIGNFPIFKLGIPIRLVIGKSRFMADSKRIRGWYYAIP
jgi:hypothetical protein